MPNLSIGIIQILQGRAQTFPVILGNEVRPRLSKLGAQT